MIELLLFIAWLIDLYIWIIIAQVILSWLVAFNVVNTSNRFVYSVGRGLYAVTEPVMGRLRRVLPTAGGIDFTPMVAIIALLFLKNVVVLGWLVRGF